MLQSLKNAYAWVRSNLVLLGCVLLGIFIFAFRQRGKELHRLQLQMAIDHFNSQVELGAARVSKLRNDYEASKRVLYRD